MVAQQGRLPLTLVGVGVDIIYWTEGGKEERRKETKKNCFKSHNNGTSGHLDQRTTAN